MYKIILFLVILFWIGLLFVIHSIFENVITHFTKQNETHDKKTQERKKQFERIKKEATVYELIYCF